MLRSAREIRGYDLRPVDEDVGTADDFLFDDRTWTVRYLVADTGNWLPGRRVLISPVALDQPDWRERTFPLKLTKQQVEEAPSVSTDQPVSEQFQVELHRHYGWPAFYVPGAGFPIYHPTPSPPEEDPDESGDPYLRSMREVEGYHIRAADGEIGHVEDFILDDETWVIRYLVIDTRNWLPSRKVLIAPAWIDSIDWRQRVVQVELERDGVESAPEYDPTQPVNREYESMLYDFHGRPHYWE